MVPPLPSSPDHVSDPARNRVTPGGAIVATPLRGAWTGNRGILHDGDRIVRSHAGSLWITCDLVYRDQRLPQWQPRHNTVLFFHDEAVSLAAGHRPCALCRRSDYNSYRTAVSIATGEPPPLARELDRRLHRERLVPGTSRRRLHRHRWRDLPVGTFAVAADTALLVLADRVVPWTPDGYGPAGARPGSGEVDVLTPPLSVAALRGGYQPQLDHSTTRD